MKHWLEPTDVIVTPEILEIAAGNVLVAETLVRRGITDADSARQFLNPDLYTPTSPFDLPDMGKAVERIEKAIKQQEKICIWGDFDVDGQTSTALLYSALRSLGADVVYYIPHRQNEGHGIHLPRLEKIIDDGTQMIITCDTGIDAFAAVDYANSRGVDVIITDHHQLDETLPDSYAVVNPQCVPAEHPLHTLPGVGCAYKVVEALYCGVGRSAELADFLDLVALGIVSDVAVQRGDTRYLLQRGLHVLRNTKRLGLQIMLENADKKLSEINEETIGFFIGPRLNALGRLGDANPCVDFLTTDDWERAHILANQLEGLNSQRRMLSEQVFQAAQAQIEKDPKLLDYAVLVLSHESWPSGIVGIVANRLVEQYHRPVIMLVTPPGKSAHGSARSVAGCDINAAIGAHADLLERYGGHTMAAGMALKAENIAEFRRMLSRTVKNALDETVMASTLQIDGYIPLTDVTMKLLAETNMLAPFGSGNRQLILATRKLKVKNKRKLGRSGPHLSLTVEDENGILHEVVWWRADPDTLPPGRFDLAYTLGINSFRGKNELQMVFVDARAVDEEPLEFAHRSDLNIVDYRNLQRDKQHNELLALDDVLVWNDGEAIQGVESVRCDKLQPAQSLVMWTDPSGPGELRNALEKVNPATIYLFGVETGMDDSQVFLQRLGGLVKYSLNKCDGEANLSVLAAATNQREATVRAGLQWMVARGNLTITSEDGDILRLSGAGQVDDMTARRQMKRIEVLLQETAAYRAYFRRADANVLLLSKGTQK